FVQDLIMSSAGSEAVAVYLKVDGELKRTLEEPKDSSGRFKAPERLPAHVLEYLEAINDYVVADEVAKHHFNKFGTVYDHLIDLDWALVLPVMFEESVIGAIAVGPKRSGDPFYPHDLDLLMTLANQAGIAVKNAQLYTEVVLANEYVENIVATIESRAVAVNPAGRGTMFNRAAEALTRVQAERLRTQ